MEVAPPVWLPAVIVDGLLKANPLGTFLRLGDEHGVVRTD
jgi:hypothetical protein